MTVKSIDDIGKEFDTIEEWKAFSYAQQKQVQSLSKKIKELELEKKSLNSQLLAIPRPDQELIDPSQPNLLMQSDAETISQVQLKILKNVSYDRELTLEEAKRLEIYNKILLSHQENTNDVQVTGQSISEADLISFLSNANDTAAK